MNTLILSIRNIHPDYALMEIKLQAKVSMLYHHMHNLQQTVSGYGKRLSTPYRVQYKGKWRRVYMCVYSNTGAAYIGKFEDRLFIS